MLLYFMRHGEAEDAGAGGDAARELTVRGSQRAEQAGLALRKLEVSPELILTSPLRRALQTAAAVGAALEASVHQERLLANHFEPGDLAPLLAAYSAPESLLLVGHEPTFSWVIGELIGGAKVEMRKGAVACLQVQGLARGGAELRWLLTAKHLSLLA